MVVVGKCYFDYLQSGLDAALAEGKDTIQMSNERNMTVWRTCHDRGMEVGDLQLESNKSTDLMVAVKNEWGEVKNFT